jgi:DNA helicase-2/ATP-dependent DNA helicase PcrA
VDEFQDVSLRQYKIAQALAGKHGNLFIVGDPDQTIYSWRGSHIKLFLNFGKEYPDAKTLVLTTNYRSTPEILAASNALIEKNEVRFPKSLSAVKGHGEKPLYRHAVSEKNEAEWICSEISRLRGEGVSLSRFAVLYRAHYLTRPLEECFIKKDLPYKLFCGVEVYGRREIRDVICYMRRVTSGDDVAFLRTVGVPPRKIGKKRLDSLKEYAERRGLSLYDALRETCRSRLFHGTRADRYVDAVETVRRRRASMTMGDALQALLDVSGYEEYMRLQGDQERLDNIAELKRAVESAGEDEDASFEDFLAKAALFTNIDREGERDTVKLMTVHTAKGMEFPFVFICGLNEGVFPSRKIETPEEMDEERRLAYVAMTRAMDRLYLSDSEGVSNDGLFKYPSRFIFDAGRENLEYAAALDVSLEGEAKRRILRGDKNRLSRQALFAPGDRVTHPAFGPGTVTEVNSGELFYSIRFDALKTERAIRFGTSLTETNAP